MTPAPKPRPRKTPFPTVINFTVANLKEAARLVRLHGLRQVQFCSESEPGFHAQVYPDDVVLYSRYCYRKRPNRIRLGELGLITLEQARQRHRAIRLQASQGQDPKGRSKVELTFLELHEHHYVPQCQSRGKRTLDTDLGRYRHWIGPVFGHVLLKDIDRTSVTRFIIKMQEAGLAPATVKKVVVQLSSCLSLAVDLDLISRNVAKGIRLPRANNQRTDFMTVQQMTSFMEAAKACPPEELVGSRLLMLAGLTGARLGECLAARHEDIDLEAVVWKLPIQKSGKPGVIHLSGAAREVIREVSAVRSNDYLFPGLRGNDRLSRPIKLFKRICKRAQVGEQWRIHDLRHAWCSAAIHAGSPIEIVSHAARHSSPVVTRIYSHPHQEALVAANEAVARLIGSAG